MDVHDRHRNGQWLAFNRSCPHAGIDLIVGGDIEDLKLTFGHSLDYCTETCLPIAANTLYIYICVCVFFLFLILLQYFRVQNQKLLSCLRLHQDLSELDAGAPSSAFFYFFGAEKNQLVPDFHEVVIACPAHTYLFDPIHGTCLWVGASVLGWMVSKCSELTVFVFD